MGTLYMAAPAAPSLEAKLCATAMALAPSEDVAVVDVGKTWTFRGGSFWCFLWQVEKKNKKSVGHVVGSFFLLFFLPVDHFYLDQVKTWTLDVGSPNNKAMSS